MVCISMFFGTYSFTKDGTMYLALDGATRVPYIVGCPIQVPDLGGGFRPHRSGRHGWVCWPCAPTLRCPLWHARRVFLFRKVVAPRRGVFQVARFLTPASMACRSYVLVLIV